jgi:RNA polymerase sigma-70 factor (ECF subfamily)
MLLLNMMYLASAFKKTTSKRPNPQRFSGPQSIADMKSYDRMLLNRARSGEQRAFDELVGKYRQRVMALSMRYTGNQADAEDAVQNTFLKAYRALAKFRGDSAFYSWLHRIAINSAKSVRSLRTRDEGIFKSTPRSVDETHRQALELKEWDTPEALALTDEVCQAVNEAIESLCEEQRAAIVLREFEGLSYSEVAASMSCPLGTVRSRVFRAREAIDSQLRHVFDDGLGRVRSDLAPRS